MLSSSLIFKYFGVYTVDELMDSVSGGNAKQVYKKYLLIPFSNEFVLTEHAIMTCKKCN